MVGALKNVTRILDKHEAEAPIKKPVKARVEGWEFTIKKAE